VAPASGDGRRRRREFRRPVFVRCTTDPGLKQPQESRRLRVWPARLMQTDGSSRRHSACATGKRVPARADLATLSGVLRRAPGRGRCARTGPRVCANARSQSLRIALIPLCAPWRRACRLLRRFGKKRPEKAQGAT